jgi:hypothetical protein
MLRQAQHDPFEFFSNRHPEALEGSRGYAKLFILSAKNWQYAFFNEGVMEQLKKLDQERKNKP